MEIVELGKKEFLAVVDSLIGTKEQQVIGVTPKFNRFSYDLLDGSSDLVLDYDQTTTGPKKYLLPAHDTLLTFKPKDATSYEAVNDTTSRVIIGVHPADLTAIALLDAAFCTNEHDDVYAARRANTAIIGIYPTRPYKYRFSGSMIDESDPYKAADLMLVDLGDDSYAVEIVTEKGKKLLGGAGKPAGSDTVKKMGERKNAVKDEIVLPIESGNLPAAMKGQERHEAFTARGEKCFSCGSCVMVCPTCFCFDVKDEVDLSLESGERYRTTDACTLENFATCAGGHNFRKNTGDRLRHRLFRKTVYLKELFGITGCVGCGRCTAACTADIASIADLVGDIAGKGN